MNTEGGEPTSCIPATHSIIFLTSGRPWPFNDFDVLCAPAACCGFGISSTTSPRQKQRSVLRRGVRRSAMKCRRAGPDLEEHIRDEHSTFTWLLEPMMERSGFQIEDAVYSRDGIFARYVARAA